MKIEKLYDLINLEIVVNNNMPDSVIALRDYRKYNKKNNHNFMFFNIDTGTVEGYNIIAPNQAIVSPNNYTKLVYLKERSTQ